MRASFTRIIVVLTLAGSSGCAGTDKARYVYQDGEFGVVGIPENTDRWPTHYRRQAEALIEGHFPEGHEIVRAEEVVEGSRTLTLQGGTTAELVPNLPTGLLTVGKLGRTASRSQADQVKIKECRIIYRRAPRAEATEAGLAAFADRATLTPTSYIDPNAAVRREEVAEGEGEGEGEGVKASAEGSEELARADVGGSRGADEPQPAGASSEE